MTPEQKIIEFYFYQFAEFDFQGDKELKVLQQGLYSPRHQSHLQKPWKRTPPDSIAILMGHAFHRTYRSFFGNKREVLTLRYLQNCNRCEICKKLKISPRTYHRYVVELLTSAENYVNQVRFEREEYNHQLKFFANHGNMNHPCENSGSNGYFSDYTQI
ncbi:MAG: hypothetical protein R3Y65_00340 [Bacillota bacterium]